MSQDIVNHPWGQSVDWSKGNRIAGYTPSRWLSGVPVGRRGGYFQGASSVASSGVSTAALGASTASGLGSLQGYPGASTGGFVSSSSDEQQLEQEQKQIQREFKISSFLYTLSFFLIGVGSIGSLIISYKSYQFDKRMAEKDEY